jgi:hypothetical protein
LEEYLNCIAKCLDSEKTIQFQELDQDEEALFKYLPSVTERTGPLSIEKITNELGLFW